MRHLLLTIPFLLLGLGACRELPPEFHPVDGSGSIDVAIAVDAAPIDPEDGAPMRRPCTTSFGSALSTDYGRLDGILVAIVKPGFSGCSGDSGHVHLQIEVAGAVYDVAVNVTNDVFTTTRDMALGDAPWAEGWNTTLGLSYTALGLHAEDFAATTTSALTDDIVHELASVNHISIFSTGYGPDGTHLVHRNNGRDGAIVTRTQSATQHVRFFRFSDQQF